MLKFPKSTYMYWQKCFERENPDHKLEDAILKIREKHENYGYRRIHASLKNNDWHVNKKKIQRIIQKLSLQVTSFGRKSRKYNSYKGHVGKVAPNRIRRRFQSTIPHQKITTDLKTIYNAPTQQQGRAALERTIEKWQSKYPNAMKGWEKNWDAITPIFKFSSDVRSIIYTTNAIESLNSTYRRLNSQRSVFPSQTALLKALYLATFEATKKWTMPVRNWGKVYGELSIMYEDRLPE